MAQIAVPDPERPRGNPFFKCKLKCCDRTFETDRGYQNKKEAEKAVAYKVLEYLNSSENKRYPRVENQVNFTSFEPVNKAGIFKVLEENKFPIPTIKISIENGNYIATTTWCGKYFECTLKTLTSAEEKLAKEVYNYYLKIKDNYQYQNSLPPPFPSQSINSFQSSNTIYSSSLQDSNTITSTSLQGSNTINSIPSNSSSINLTNSNKSTTNHPDSNQYDKCYLYDLLKLYCKNNNFQIPQLDSIKQSNTYKIKCNYNNEKFESELCLTEDMAYNDISMKIISRYDLWKDIMNNTFNKVIKYIVKFLHTPEGDNDNIKYGNVLFNDSDYLINIKRLSNYIRTIVDVLEKCADISSEIQLPSIPSETPTPSPTPTDTPITISTPSETQTISELKVLRESDIQPKVPKSIITKEAKTVRYLLDSSYCKFNCSSEYYLYVLTCSSSDNSNVFQNCYGIISQNKEEQINYSFSFINGNNKYNGNWLYDRPIELSPSNIQSLQTYTNLILKFYNSDQYNYDCRVGKQYYICKLNVDKNEDFYGMYKFIETYNQYQIPLKSENNNLLNYMKVAKDCSNWIISTKSLDVTDLSSQHLYKVVEVTNITPNNDCKNETYNMISYRDLYYNLYGDVCKDDQYLVKCVLYNNKDNNTNEYFYCIPEFSTVCYDEIQFSSYLPSLAYEYEYVTRFSQFKKKLKMINTQTEYYDVNDVNMIVNCLTPYLYNEDFNYERYSIFGNTLTKFFLSLSLYYQYSSETASFLSCKRNEIFTNKIFKETAETLKLYEVIRSLNMPKSWIPMFSNCVEETEIPESSLKSSLLAISYFKYKNEMNYADGLINAFDYYSEFIIQINQPSIVIMIKQCLHYNSYYDTYNYTNKEKWMYDVEKIIDYTFKNTELLKRAFTLKSITTNDPYNYETLEFIGDSFMDWIIIDFIEKNYTNCNIQQLIDIKNYLTNNDTLAYISASIGINQFLQNSRSSVDGNISEFVKQLIDQNINYGNGYEFLEISPFCPSKKPSRRYDHNKWGTGVDTPKVLADIFESLIGAVLIDGGYNNAEKVINRIYTQLLKNISPLNIPKHPVTELSHYLSSNNSSPAVYESEIVGDKLKVSVKVNNECIGSAISKFKSNAVIKAAEMSLINVKRKII